jgi:hypothetical protein
MIMPVHWGNEPDDAGEETALFLPIDIGRGRWVRLIPYGDVMEIGDVAPVGPPVPIPFTVAAGSMTQQDWWYRRIEGIRDASDDIRLDTDMDHADYVAMSDIAQMVRQNGTLQYDQAFQFLEECGGYEAVPEGVQLYAYDVHQRDQKLVVHDGTLDIFVGTRTFSASPSGDVIQQLYDAGSSNFTARVFEEYFSDAVRIAAEKIEKQGEGTITGITKSAIRSVVGYDNNGDIVPRDRLMLAVSYFI